MEAGQWDESAALIANAQQLLERGAASDGEKQKATGLMDRVRAGKERAGARGLGLEALEAGGGAGGLLGLCVLP